MTRATPTTAPPRRPRWAPKRLPGAKPYRAAPSFPLHILGTDGRLCVSVPLSGKNGKGRRMTLDALDWERITRTHGDHWTVAVVDGIRLYVMGTGPHVRVSLARAITGAGPGDAVMFRDGDALNLCRGNMEVMGKREAVMRAFGR